MKTSNKISSSKWALAIIAFISFPIFAHTITCGDGSCCGTWDNGTDCDACDGNNVTFTFSAKRDDGGTWSPFTKCVYYLTYTPNADGSGLTNVYQPTISGFTAGTQYSGTAICFDCNYYGGSWDIRDPEDPKCFGNASGSCGIYHFDQGAVIYTNDDCNVTQGPFNAYFVDCDNVDCS